MDRTYDNLPKQHVESIRENLRLKAISIAEVRVESEQRTKITELSKYLSEHDLIMREFLILMELYNYSDICESRNLCIGISTEYSNIVEAFNNLLKRELIFEKHVQKQGNFLYCSLTEKGMEQIKSIVDFIGPYVSFECNECGSDFPIKVLKATQILQNIELGKDRKVRCNVCNYY